MQRSRQALLLVVALGAAALSVSAAADASANPAAPSPPNGSVSLVLRGLTVDITPTARYHVMLWGNMGTLSGAELTYGAGGSSCPVGWDFSNADIDRLVAAVQARRTVAIGASQIAGQSLGCIGNYTFTS